MTKLVVAAASELEPFAKRAAAKPGWTGSLEAISMLPREARGTAAAGPAFAASAWLRGLPRPLAQVAFPDLARHVLGEDGATLTPRRHEKVHDATGPRSTSGWSRCPGNVPAAARPGAPRPLSRPGCRDAALHSLCRRRRRRGTRVHPVRRRPGREGGGREDLAGRDLETLADYPVGAPPPHRPAPLVAGFHRERRADPQGADGCLPRGEGHRRRRRRRRRFLDGHG